MAPGQFPMEILELIALQLREDNGELCFSDFNSVLKVNHALYCGLKRTFWEEAAGCEFARQRVFAQLIRTDDLTHLKFFLVLGADIETNLPEFESNANDYRYHDVRGLKATPLKAAAALDNHQMARFLLQHGAKLAQTDKYGRLSHSVIHAARSPEMIRLLLIYHADLNQHDGNDYWPLHYYVMRHNFEAMRAALRYGAKVDPTADSRQPHGYTPLHEAAQQSLEAVQILLDHGADCRKRDHDLNSPLHWAAIAGKKDVVQLLLEIWLPGISEKDIGGRFPLHWAAERGNVDVVELLVQIWPAGKQRQDGNKETPLAVFTRMHTWLELTELERQKIFALLRRQN
jgi:hypothetical protein